MTKAEKLRIYQSMEDKILQTLDGRTGEQLICEETNLALNLIGRFTMAAWRAEADDPAKTSTSPGAEATDPDPAPAPEPEPAPEPAPVPAPASEPDGETMTKEEVRAKLAALATNPKVNVAAIMAEMGYAKLSDVPAARYRELLDKANAAKEA